MVPNSLNGFTPALDLLKSLWAERPARTAKMQAKGTAKYRTLVTWPDGSIKPGAEKARDRKTGEIVGDGEPLVITDVLLMEHVNGKATYATRLIGADGLAQVLAIELDNGAEDGAHAVLNTMQVAGIIGFSIVCPGSDGHNGSHSYALYAQAWNPDRLQEQARQIAQAAGVSNKELYPSGANLRLPFGKHQRTNTRGMLLLQNGRRFQLDRHDELAEGAAALAVLPRNTLPPPVAPVKVITDRQKPTSTDRVMPLTDYDQRATPADVEQMLEGAGWEQTGGRSSISYWARPGKNAHDGHSATLGYVADTVLSVFSTDDPDLPGEPGKGKHYGPAAIYIRLIHGGDAKAAAKDLYARGYGTRIGAIVAQRRVECLEGDARPRSHADTATSTNSAPTLSRGFVLMCLGQGEAGDAQLFEKIYRGQLCYDHAAGAWYIFGSHAWSRYNGMPRRAIWSRIAAAYVAFAADLQASLEHESSDDKRREIITTVDLMNERAKKLRGLSRVNNVLTFAQELLGIAGDEWDADPWLLGIENGVLDLRTGHLRDGQPDDYIRTLAPTRWEGFAALCPRWERFISEIMSDEADRVAFLQRLLGYGLNGSTKEHLLAVFVGERGRNGKRVLFETLQHVLGTYAQSVSTDVLIGQNHKRIAGSAQPHLMELQGKRMAYCSETAEHDALSTAQVKNITGGDPITARWLNENPVTFMPTHTLFLQTNRKPQAPADDDALWDRVKVIEFKVRFVDEPQAADERPRDLALEAALQAEAAGILAWLVRGGLDWQQGGLRTPASVRLARDTYRKEESIDPFLEAACIEVVGFSAEGGALYAAYENWCKANSLRVKTSHWFGRQIGAKFERGRVPGSGRTCYFGIGLETTEFSEESQAKAKKGSDGIGVPENA